VGWGEVSLSTTVTQQNKTPGLFFAYSDVGEKGDYSYGIGINLIELLGFNIYINSDANIGIGLQLPP